MGKAQAPLSNHYQACMVLVCKKSISNSITSEKKKFRNCAALQWNPDPERKFRMRLAQNVPESTKNYTKHHAIHETVVTLAGEDKPNKYCVVVNLKLTKFFF
jgi:hypothetical protein